MSEVITRFLNRPTLAKPHFASSQTMIFIIDAAQSAEAWGVFMHNCIPCKFQQLWSETPFQAHKLQGPTWFEVDSRSVDQLADLCHEPQGGIALTCSNPASALIHARKLLSDSARNIHDPAVWAAMAMESDHQQDCLFGPWSEVFTPAPDAAPNARRWHSWKNDSVAATSSENPLVFAAGLYSTYVDIRWLHWLRNNPQPFSQLSDEDLPRAASNLNFLVKHGIGVDRHLLQLSALVIHGDLGQRDDLMPIFNSRELPHRRVEQLLQGVQS